MEDKYPAKKVIRYESRSGRLFYTPEGAHMDDIKMDIYEIMGDDTGITHLQELEDEDHSKVMRLLKEHRELREVENAHKRLDTEFKKSSPDEEEDGEEESKPVHTPFRRRIVKKG